MDDTPDYARQTRAEGEHDRRLALCRQAIEAAEDTRETARADAVDRVDEVESRLDELGTLRNELESKHDTR